MFSFTLKVPNLQDRMVLKELQYLTFLKNLKFGCKTWLESTLSDIKSVEFVEC